MRISWHVVATLLIVNRMSKGDHQNKVLPESHIVLNNRSKQ